MHSQPLEWCRKIIGQVAESVPGAVVVEFGSYDMNGSVRPFFAGCKSYTGIDWRPGPGVDLVAKNHEAKIEPGSVDFVVSTQALEHDPYWRATLAAAIRALGERNSERPGFVILTWAGPGTDPHALDTAPPVGAAQKRGHYRNLTTAEVAAELRKLWGDAPGVEIVEESDRDGLDAFVFARVTR